MMLSALKLETHPEKTFIGRIEKGFDFLGYSVGPAGLTVARQTSTRFVTHITRLYKRKPGESFDSARLGDDVTRWVRWTTAGLGMAGPS